MGVRREVADRIRKVIEFETPDHVSVWDALENAAVYEPFASGRAGLHPRQWRHRAPAAVRQRRDHGQTRRLGASSRTSMRHTGPGRLRGEAEWARGPRRQQAVRHAGDGHGQPAGPDRRIREVRWVGWVRSEAGEL